MDAEDKQKLDRILQLTEENNTFIKKIRKSQRNAALFRLFYWLVIIAITFGAYYVAKPYVGEINNFFSQASENLKGAGITLPGSSFFDKKNTN